MLARTSDRQNSYKRSTLVGFKRRLPKNSFQKPSHFPRFLVVVARIRGRLYKISLTIEGHADKYIWKIAQITLSLLIHDTEDSLENFSFQKTSRASFKIMATNERA